MDLLLKKVNVKRCKNRDNFASDLNREILFYLLKIDRLELSQLLAGIREDRYHRRRRASNREGNRTPRIVSIAMYTLMYKIYVNIE